VAAQAKRLAALIDHRITETVRVRLSVAVSAGGRRRRSGRYNRRWSISFFNSAMARAGLRPLGQALVQLKIVWQR
jgi:hypothetical protein